MVSFNLIFQLILLYLFHPLTNVAHSVHLIGLCLSLYYYLPTIIKYVQSSPLRSLLLKLPLFMSRYDYCPLQKGWRQFPLFQEAKESSKSHSWNQLLSSHDFFAQRTWIYVSLVTIMSIKPYVSTRELLGRFWWNVVDQTVWTLPFEATLSSSLLISYSS
jgi:hypothetical protein